MSFDFGNLQLTAAEAVNLRFAEIVLLTGVQNDQTSIREVEIQLPRRIDGLEMCAAWVVWQLDQGSQGFVPARQTSWVEMGRQNFHLLPWYFDHEAYDKRPHCFVEHDWAKVAFRSLDEHLAQADPDDVVWLTFDGAVLTLRCGHMTVPCPASGEAWEHAYSIRATDFVGLPKRVSRDGIEISVWQSTLTVGRHTFRPVQEGEGEAERSSHR